MKDVQLLAKSHEGHCHPSGSHCHASGLEGCDALPPGLESYWPFATSEGDTVVPPRHSASIEQATVDLVGTATIKSQLQALELEDAMTVFVVRGVSKLGLNAGDALRDYFGYYGVVKAVHAPATPKKCGSKKVQNAKQHHHVEDVSGRGRQTRAPGRCFVVMSTADERNGILESAAEHLIQNVKVTIAPFTKSAPVPMCASYMGA